MEDCTLPHTTLKSQKSPGRESALLLNAGITIQKVMAISSVFEENRSHLECILDVLYTHMPRAHFALVKLILKPAVFIYFPII